ncbi:hypothetical protein Tsubulata_000117 [Turnera subulata]|uniref:High mobility group B protein 6 n=1 Tax=Turnera subulata TaxID=218843 RepID=A0A9Q0FKQ8_9ROSI|nr:hypothetical protein Tsubulata_000117 [Turnera subulata]
MLKLQSPLTGDKKPRPGPGRKPLQPKNTNSPANPTPTPDTPLSKLKQGWIEIPSVGGDSNKENHPVYATPPPPAKQQQQVVESLDVSLAEELSAIRQKLERLRLDKERTEKMLKEREVALDLKMKEILQRGEAQKRLEIEVDRLYRLKQLQSYTTRISPIRSLREKEHEKKPGEVIVQGMGEGGEDMDGSDAGIELQSPSPTSSWGSNPMTPQLQLVSVK